MGPELTKVHCWLRLRRHTWVETDRQVKDVGQALRTEAMAPGLVPPEELMGLPLIEETCMACGSARSRWASDA